MYRCLIIDDEKTAQIAIMKLGRWHHYDIEDPETASDGKEGLRMMREMQPDLVFIDMNMPVLDGCKFLEAAKKEFSTQFIVVSGYDNFNYVHQALYYGAVDYLLKPIEEELLNKAIEKALRQIDPSLKFSEVASHTERSDADDVIRIIKEYLDNHYCEKLTMQELEDKFGFSSAYLSRLFDSTYGYTIYEYILKLRMNRAKELLEDTTIKIQDISERLSYSDNHYFSKAFKTYYKVSPTQYREKYLEKYYDTVNKCKKR